MAIVRPFRALRPPVERVAEVASVPYDVVNTEEARELAKDRPFSFLHVSRPEIDLPEGTDIYSDTVYEKAASNFQHLINSCPLKKDDEPNLYIYRLIMGEHEQIGIAACCSVDEYDKDIIRKHERTRRDKEDDRTRHIITLRAQTGPVFLTYQTDRRIDTLVAAAITNNPIYDFTAEDNVRHTVWIAPNADAISKTFLEVSNLYIADGHHRAASASRTRESLRKENSDHSGNEDYNYFLAVLFPSDQVRILPYNRIVKDLNSLSEVEFIKRVGEVFDISEDGTPTPETSGKWSMYLNKKWYSLKLRSKLEEINDPVATLDVSILQNKLLDPILGIKDVRTDKRIDFVGGIRGTSELERLVNGGQAAVAFSLYPTTVEDLFRVSDAGSIMPPKSTWFEPKLRDGLLIHAFE
jgi:uncharacterized protein (DUF1015 family)